MDTMRNLSATAVEEAPAEHGAVLSAVVTGQAAGLIMAVVVMAVFALFLGTSPLYPVQVIGSMVFGESALQGFHLGALLAGLLLHQLGPSLLWGAVFGALASKFRVRTTGESLKLGLGVGVLSMVGPYLLIPFLMNALHGADYWNREVPMMWDWAAHIVFGAAFALYPYFRKRLVRN
jgi:hypothetical protein